MSEIDVFSAASAAATADLAAPEASAQSAPAAATETPAPAPESVTAEPQPEAAAPEASAPATEATPPEEEVELTWNGQKVRLPKSEAISLAQRGYDYSQKTAALAQARREFEAQKVQLDREAAELRQVLSDPQQLRQLVQWAAQQHPPEALDPNAGVTTQQAQELIASQMQQLQQKVQTDIRRAQLELESNRLEQEYKVAIGTHMNQLFTKHPVLQDVEGMDQLLKQEALAYQQSQLAANPGKEVTLDEIKGVMAKAAERRSQKLAARFENQLKQSAVQKATVINNGIDAGGSPAAQAASKPPKLFSPEFRQMIEEDLRRYNAQ